MNEFISIKLAHFALTIAHNLRTTAPSRNFILKYFGHNRAYSERLIDQVRFILTAPGHLSEVLRVSLKGVTFDGGAPVGEAQKVVELAESMGFNVTFPVTLGSTREMSVIRSANVVTNLSEFTKFGGVTDLQFAHDALVLSHDIYFGKCFDLVKMLNAVPQDWQIFEMFKADLGITDLKELEDLVHAILARCETRSTPLLRVKLQDSDFITAHATVEQSKLTGMALEIANLIRALGLEHRQSCFNNGKFTRETWGRSDELYDHPAVPQPGYEEWIELQAF